MQDNPVAIGGVITALVTAIGALWRHMLVKQKDADTVNLARQHATEKMLLEQQEARDLLVKEQMEDTRSRLERTEVEHKETSAKYHELSNEFSGIKGLLKGHEQARQDLGELGQLSADTIAWMKEQSEERAGG